MTRDAELELAAACCRWPRDADALARIRILAEHAHWNRLSRVIRRHRILPLVVNGLKAAGVQPPPAASQWLTTAAAGRGSREALKRTAESLRLQKLFDDHGLPCLFIKGESLAMRVYGAVGLKEAWDIDLLTSPDAVGEAIRLLGANGYRLAEPAGLSAAQFSTYAAFTPECLLVHDQSGVQLELHWRLAENPQFLPGVDARSPSQAVTLPGGLGNLRTLRDEDLFAFLCVHGARHVWARLKWLADVAAWLAAEDAPGREALYRAAVQRGAGRAAAQAMLLSKQYLGLDLPPGLQAEMESDPAVRILVWLGGKAIHYKVNVRNAALPPFTDLLSDYLLGHGWAYRFSILSAQWRGDWDRIHLPLPASAHFLYPLIRAPSWLVRRLVSGRP